MFQFVKKMGSHNLFFQFNDFKIFANLKPIIVAIVRIVLFVFKQVIIFQNPNLNGQISIFLTEKIVTNPAAGGMALHI